MCVCVSESLRVGECVFVRVCERARYRRTIFQGVANSPKNGFAIFLFHPAEESESADDSLNKP